MLRVYKIKASAAICEYTYYAIQCILTKVYHYFTDIINTKLSPLKCGFEAEKLLTKASHKWTTCPDELSNLTIGIVELSLSLC